MIIQLENGQEIELPDGSTPDQIDDVVSHMSRPVQRESFLSRTGDDLLKRRDELRAADEAYKSGQQGLLQTGLQYVGKGAFGTINDALGNVMQSGIEALPASAQQAIGNAANYVSDSAVGDVARQYGKNYEDFSAANPNAARSLESVANIAGIVPIGKAAQLAGKTTGGIKRGAEGLAEAYASKYPVGNGPFDPVTVKAMPQANFDAMATHSAISDSYGAAKEAARPYFDLTKQIAAGESAKVPGLKSSLESMISDIKNTPFHEAATEIPYLEKQLSKISKDGTMPLNDAVELKQNINSNFNPKRFAKSSDSPYSTLGGILDDSLSEAGRRIPEFEEARALQNKNWLNTVKVPFEDNKVLQRFWKPEDYYAKKSVDSGMLEELPDATKQRAATMIVNIKNPVQLDAIRRVIPQNMSESLSAAKIQNITRGGGLSRLSAAGKTLVGAPNLTPSGIRNTLTNLGETIGGVPYSQEEKLLIEALKKPGPTLSTRYANPFSNLKTSIQQQKDLAAEMQPFGPPHAAIPPEPPQLLLPAPQPPETIYAAGRGRTKPPRAMTPDEITASNAMNQRAKELGLTRDVMDAQQAAAISRFEQNNPLNQFFGQIGNSPFRINQTALDPKSVGLKTSPFIDPEDFAKGGPVKKRNLTAEFLARKRA